MRVTLIAFTLCAASLHAQSDNRYCRKDNTWLGTSATNPVLHDGPAELPHVCFNTDPANTPSPGRKIQVSASDKLQTAYNNAKCGDTLLLAHGAKWDEQLDFSAKNCDDQHWITISTDGVITGPGQRISPAYADQMANLTLRNPSGVKTFGDHLRFIGIYWTRNRTGVVYALPGFLNGANKVIFDRNYMHGTPGEETQHGVVVNTGNYIAVIDSWMDEFHCIAKTGACTDAQAVSGGTSVTGDVTASGPVKIVNNFLEAAGENILFGGAKANGPGPNDVEIRRNYLYKDPKWNPLDPGYIGTLYIVKNNFELKNGTRMLLEGNVLENNWGGFTQSGHAVLITPKNQNVAGIGGVCPDCEVYDITFRYNAVHNAAGFAQIAAGVNDSKQYCKGLHRVSIHDNVIDGLQYPTCSQCASSLIQIGSYYDAANIPQDDWVLTDVSIRNNTLIAVGDLAVTSGAKYPMSTMINASGIPPGVATQQVNNISFQNNVSSTMLFSAYPTGGGANNCATTFYAKPNNAATIWKQCYIGASPFTGNVLVNYSKATTDFPDGNLFAPSWAAVGFDSFTDGVYSLPQDSPYVGKGANTDAVNMATFGVRELQ